ncbi:unnamed protein product [Rotaria sp. Silwood2]|nr:unnamed protein product [Rotaria sp. Silwood2]
MRFFHTEPLFYSAIHNYQLYQNQEIPLRLKSPLRRVINRTRRQQQIQVQPVSQISYSYLSEPYDVRTDFFPPDSVFQRPYGPSQTVEYYLPDNRNEILSVPSINKSILLSTTNNDWPYYASPASSIPYYYSLYYDRPELCFSQWPNIRERIFDQHNRSNLASIIWYPFLCSDRNITTEIWHCQLPNCGFETTSFRIDPLTSTIGGIIDTDYNLSPGRYIVTNDILIKPDKRLTIQSSQLEFLNGIGIFVHGELIIQGVDGSPTRLNLLNNKSSTSILVNQQKQQEKIQHEIMLVDGPTIYEGRLFVTSQKDGSGTVCNHGWTKENSILICMSLGFIHDPNDYLYPMMNTNQTIINDPIIWSEVDCDLYQDQTIEQCRKEIVHTCDHTDDVWIKCLPPSCGGIHIFPTYSKIQLEFVHFDSAGQYDIDKDEIHAALHIDLLSHSLNTLKNLTFTNNIIGLQINHIHPINFDYSIIHHSSFHHNYYLGVLLRSSFFNFSHCTFTHNKYSAMKFDSSFSYNELEQLRINIGRSQTTIHTIDLLYDQFYEVERNKFAFITTTFGGYNSNDNILFNTLNIRTDPSFILIIDLIDYNPLSNINEQLIICEVECHQRLGLTQSLSYKKWSLANDRDLFPLITSYSSLQFHYRLYRYRTSRLTFIIYSIPAPIFSEGKFLSDISIRFHRCLFSYNQHDIIYYLNDREKTNNQYALTNQLKTDIERLIEQLLMGKKINNNDPSFDIIDEENRKIREEFQQEEFQDKQLKRQITIINIKKRYKNSTIQINECLFEYNQNRSILIDHQSKKLHSNQVENNIKMLMNETIQENKQFIPIQFTLLNLDAHPLIFSDRLIRFEITHTNFTHNHDLLLNLTFPRLYPFNRTIFASLSIWPYVSTRSLHTPTPLIYTIPSHGVRIYKNIFLSNEYTSIRLMGFHTSFNLTHSLFENNLNHQTSLIDLRHVEKDILINENIFQRNQVHNLLSFDSNSHAPFHNNLLYQSLISFNQFIDNKPSLFTKYPYLPSSCIRIIGSHNITIQRNLFENIHYDYELISALLTDTINTTLDATINWWGSDVGQAIQNRILDFTKRSDHAYVKWNPFLACRELTCAQIQLPIQTILQMNRPLRGLITSNTLIHKRREPYLINGDLIVMPGVKLTIEPGVELHFAPNTGLLILGHLNASGTPKDPIFMRLANKKFVMEQIANGHNSFQYHFTDEVPFSKYKIRFLITRMWIRNQVYNNTGVDIVSMIGFEKITAPFPAMEMNSFRNNRAIGQLNQQLFDRTGAVIEIGNPRQIYMFNTFDNWESRYEIRTRSRYFEPNRMESRSVNASLNFWGRIGDVDDIGARIYDKFDNKTLIEVNYYPPYLDSTRLRQGKCDPGWTLDDTLCYIYFGAITTYRIAQEMCSSIDARITRRDTPLNRLVILRSLVRTSQYQGINSDAVPSSGIWLKKDNNEFCRIFNDMETIDVSCSATAAFICEKEQQFDGFKLIIRNDLLLAIAGIILMIILIMLFLCCWLCKSRQRRKDNFHRQNSLRRSVKQEINKQSTLSLQKSNDNTLIKSSTLSTLTNGTTNKLPLSSLSLSSRPLSSVTINSDNDISTSSPVHHDFSILKLNHNIPKASTPAFSDDNGSQRALVLTTHTDQSSVYSTATTDSATLYRSRRRFERIQTPTMPPSAPPVTHRRSLRNINQHNLQQDSTTSVSTGSVSPPPAYVSPAHQSRRYRSDQLQLLTPNNNKKTYAIGIQADSYSQASSRSSTKYEPPPPPLETDI